MTPGTKSLTGIALTGAIVLAVGTVALRGTHQDSRAALPVSSLAESQSAVASTFQVLDGNLAQALASGDPYAIARRGAEVRAFQVRVDAPAQARNSWRREKLELWLTAVTGVHTAIDTSFDATDRPAINLAPMTRTGLASNSGMDPKAIRNDVVRADYVERLEDNAQKAFVHTSQLTVRRLDKEWTDDVQSHIASQYDLTSEADRTDIDEAIRARITDSEERERLRALLLNEPEVGAVLASDGGAPAH